MKNLIYIFLITISSQSLLPAEQERPLVVTSASMMADMTRNIGGELINVEMIVPIGGDPHLHEPTPNDVRLVTRADLIIINGLTFEGWINELIDNSGTQAQTVTITEGIDILTSQQYSNSADPHAWMDASNGVIYADNILKALTALDPENASFYEENHKRYSSELKSLDIEIEAAINTIPEQQRILITSHDAFQYYGRRYGVQLEAIMGISTEAEAQTSDVIRVNKVIKESKVPAVFVESTINPKLIEQIAQDNQISIGGKLYADSLGDKNSPADTYINMLRYNTQTIVTALKKSISPDSNHNSTNFLFILILGAVLFLGLLLLIFKLNK